MVLTVTLAGAAGLANLGVTTAGAAASTEKPLVVYSSEGLDAVELKAFREATGIPVKLETSTSSALVTRIEHEKGDPTWGVLWLDGPTELAQLDKRHLLVRGYEPHVSWNTEGKTVLPKDKSYVPTGVTLAGAVVYTPNVVTDPPTSWSALLQHKWKGAVGIDNPNRTEPTYQFLAGMMSDMGGKNGIKKGEAYLKKLKKNGLVVQTTNGTTLRGLTSGHIKLAVLQSSAALGSLHTHPGLRVQYLAPETLLPSAVGIDAKAPTAEKNEAKKFVAYVLSPAGQQVMESATPSDASHYYPVVTGVAPPTTVPNPATIKTQSITAALWGVHEHAIDEWFTKHVAN